MPFFFHDKPNPLSVTYTPVMTHAVASNQCLRSVYTSSSRDMFRVGITDVGIGHDEQLP